MNFGNLLKTFDALMALREATRRLKRSGSAAQPQPDAALSQPTAQTSGQIEARLTSVVVAALKEAFDRDHARLELERTQLEEQRRRSEEALRLELRRQAVDHEISRLRLLGGTAMVGWIVSLLLLGWRIPLASTSARISLGLGWLLLLAALGTAFTAMGRVGRSATGELLPLTNASSVPMWLLIFGLALTAITLLI
jgi:hypothetical protein